MTDLKKLAMRSAVDLVLWQEISWSSDGSAATEETPGDPGGATKYGIDQRDHPNVDVTSLTLEGAVAHYEYEWLRNHYVLLPRPDIAIAVFSAGVNIGHETAIKILQKQVGVERDGIIGPITAEAVIAGGSLSGFCAEWRGYYRTLDPALFQKFGEGWDHRIDSTMEFCQVIERYQP